MPRRFLIIFETEFLLFIQEKITSSNQEVSKNDSDDSITYLANGKKSHGKPNKSSGDKAKEHRNTSMYDGVLSSYCRVHRVPWRPRIVLRKDLHKDQRSSPVRYAWVWFLTPPGHLRVVYESSNLYKKSD
ncbi:hypothetical protein GYMLUDRAFT_61840 [Collybiopsis luxurians FD-317 M1]|uniref:Uncharacterized protein n=1 Tax=Collybiopsis luxurians FD-317 M1 TaxID=944289 RepID=A0A0D0BP30_9AGAR|nr:hypothetical protein GYMLUDRAFT_61840 [Collybiopsis luxurians FD-317 M1]